jgi:hypothetical protein
MIFDTKLRAKVKVQRDAIHNLLQHHLPNHDLTLIGDSEIQLTWHSNPHCLRETLLTCSMYGGCQDSCCRNSWGHPTKKGINDNCKIKINEKI